MKLFLSGFSALSLLIFSCQAPSGQKNNGTQTDPLDISSQDSSVRPQSERFNQTKGSFKIACHCEKNRIS
jgi:hypothetical protein